MKNKERKPMGYWTKENCEKEALKYSSRSNFERGSNGAYDKSLKNNWLNDICKHMITKKKPNGYWTKEKCLEEALKYRTKTDFAKKSSGAYDSVYRNKWVEECCSHMEILGDLYKRLIYVAVFADNHIYVGLTGNPNKRFDEHLTDNRCIVYKHINRTELKPKFIKLTDYLDNENASIQEGVFKEKYEKEGYVILNIAKTGSLGSAPRKWTKEKCTEEAKKYESRSEFKIKNNSAYSAVIRNNWGDDCCKHMVRRKKPNGYWNIKENCINVALQCESRTEFIQKYPRAHDYACKNKWLEEICSHMKLLKEIWTFEKIYNIAKNHKTLFEFRTKNKRDYEILRSNLEWKEKIYTEFGWKSRKK